MENKKPVPLLFIIIIIILAAIVLVKFSNTKNQINNNVTPTPVQSSVATTTNSKLPAGSIPPGDPEFLKNKLWVWEKTVMNDDTVITPKKIDAFNITLDSDGNINGRTDCNSFFGTYKIGSDGVITFGPLASTKMFCEDSQEATFTSAIFKVGSYSTDISGNPKLLLYFNEGLIILNYKEIELI